MKIETIFGILSMIGGLIGAFILVHQAGWY